MYNRLVQDILEHAARQTPDKIALTAEGKHFSYAQLNSMANQAANLFKATGLKKGDRVLLCLENCVELVVGMFATTKAGGVIVNVSPDTPHSKLAFYLTEMQPTVVMAQGYGPKATNFLQAYKEAEAKSIIFWVTKDSVSLPEGLKTENSFSFGEELATASLAALPRRVIDVDLAMIIYTSGSTGQPKGVLIGHKHVLAAATTIAEYLENKADDVILSILPLSFSYGLYQLFVTFLTGGRLVLERNFTFPAKTLALFQSEKVTGFAGVATVFNIMLQQPGLEKMDWSSLKYLTCAGSALLPAQYQKMRQIFPSTKIIPMYGMTECTRIAYCPPEIVEQKPASVGVPVPNLEIEIVDEDGQPVKVGETGELTVRTAFIAYGYYNRPQETAERFRPGKLPGDRVIFTGDLFRQDEDGHLYFVSRKDEIIKSRGEKVPPREVENALMQLEGVADASVVGVDDELLGQAIAAAIMLKDGATLTEKQVLAHCKALLEPFMLPKYVKFVDNMPKLVSGKISKPEVKKLF